MITPNGKEIKTENELFMERFGEEWNNRLADVKDYNDFRQLVGSMADKYIILKKPKVKKNKIVGDKQWNYFYAAYITPSRARLFPEKQAWISNRREIDAQRKQNQGPSR
jgi:hypothetical protein